MNKAHRGSLFDLFYQVPTEKQIIYVEVFKLDDLLNLNLFDPDLNEWVSISS